MKIFLLGCLLIVAIGSSYGFNDKQEKFCQSVAGLSESIMKGRQHGADVTKAMNVFKDEKHPAIRKMMQELVISAYEKPRYNVSSNKAQAVVDFKNETYVSCVKSLN